MQEYHIPLFEVPHELEPSVVQIVDQAPLLEIGQWFEPDIRIWRFVVVHATVACPI